MDSIISGMKEKLHSDTIKILQDGDIQLSNTQLMAIRDLFENATNPFEKLGTRYQQDKYIQEHLNYLVSKICFENT